MSPPSTPAFATSFPKGFKHFRAAQYLEAHEAWEVGWKASAGAEKQYLQVLIMWATAFHHATRGNDAGAQKLMGRALERLVEHETGAPPFDAEVLREALVKSWEALNAGNYAAPEWEPVPPEAEEAQVDLSVRTQCPYCGEPVAVEVDAEAAAGAKYVEDCPVCCNPWTVTVDSEGVTLARDDD